MEAGLRTRRPAGPRPASAARVPQLSSWKSSPVTKNDSSRIKIFTASITVERVPQRFINHHAEQLRARSPHCPALEASRRYTQPCDEPCDNLTPSDSDSCTAAEGSLVPSSFKPFSVASEAAARERPLLNGIFTAQLLIIHPVEPWH